MIHLAIKFPLDVLRIREEEKHFHRARLKAVKLFESFLIYREIKST